MTTSEPYLLNILRLAVWIFNESELGKLLRLCPKVNLKIFAALIYRDGMTDSFHAWISARVREMSEARKVEVLDVWPNQARDSVPQGVSEFLCARRFQSRPRLGKSLYRGNGLPGKLVYWLIQGNRVNEYVTNG